MAKGWMDNFIADLTTKNAEVPRPAAPTTQTISQMFGRLCSQIEADLAKYNSRFPAMAVQYAAGQDGIVIRRESYPYINVAVSLADSSFRLVTVKRKIQTLAMAGSNLLYLWSVARMVCRTTGSMGRIISLPMKPRSLKNYFARCWSS